MRLFSTALCVALVCAWNTGCSVMAPQYTASLGNVQTLKDAGDYKAKVGAFDAGSGSVNSVSLRGSSLNSPYQNSYANYLGEAIKQELSLAGKLSPGTDVEISGVLQKNDFSAAGISTGSADMEARFVVKKAGEVRYDQVKTVHHEWESSFMGAVAIPRAVNEYPNVVQKLLAALYSDQSFLDALK